MQPISSIALILKSIIGADLQTATTQELPHIIKAIVNKVDVNKVSLAWNNQQIEARLETVVKKGETLLLQHNGKKDGQHYYKILARLEEQQQTNNYTGLQAVIFTEGKKPALLTVRNYNKADAQLTSPCLDIVFPTVSFGFVGIRVFSFNKPYPCCFLVEKEEYGKLFQDLTSVWFAGTGEDKFPVNFQPFHVISGKEYMKGSTILDRKA